jgi:membrane protein DedA with SNARE-associated domain
MSNLTDVILAGMLTYGAPMLAVALLLGALGLPLPGTMLLLAAGAFVRQGVLDWMMTPVLALIATMLGDSGSYYVGRVGGMMLRSIRNTTAWQKAQETFVRRGGLAILLTRFLLTPLALPTNLIAGSNRYQFNRFFLWMAVGEVIWVAGYMGLGYVFAYSWEALSSFVGNLSGLLVGLLVLGVGGYLAYRWLKPKPAAAFNRAALTTLPTTEDET